MASVRLSDVQGQSSPVGGQVSAVCSVPNAGRAQDAGNPTPSSPLVAQPLNRSDLPRNRTFLWEVLSGL